MPRSNLLSIKCNGAQRYPRDYASNSLGTLPCKFKSSQCNCGLSMHILPTPHLRCSERQSSRPLRSQRVGQRSTKCRSLWFWRCVAPSDTPHRSLLEVQKEGHSTFEILPLPPLSVSLQTSESPPLKYPLICLHSFCLKATRKKPRGRFMSS